VPIDGRVAPRSGLASKNFIDTGAGVIDADYRGEVKVLLFNFSDVDFTIKVGDRVAQLVLERVCFLPFYFFRYQLGVLIADAWLIADLYT
jgi:dUTP pyrophosphatase